MHYHLYSRSLSGRRHSDRRELKGIITFYLTNLITQIRRMSDNMYAYNVL